MSKQQGPKHPNFDTERAFMQRWLVKIVPIPQPQVPQTVIEYDDMPALEKVEDSYDWFFNLVIRGKD